MTPILEPGMDGRGPDRREAGSGGQPARLQVDDGTVTTVRNRAIVDGDDPRTRYARSALRALTTACPHAWITRRVLEGTLERLRPSEAAVRVTVYAMD